VILNKVLELRSHILMTTIITFSLLRYELQSLDPSLLEAKKSKLLIISTVSVMGM